MITVVGQAVTVIVTWSLTVMVVGLGTKAEITSGE